jgi:hypothetical protein
MQVTKAGIERIKGASDLAAVMAERGIELRRRGRVLVARCPFHEEKTPSFTVTPAKGLFHCFGCGAAGDVIGFVTKHDRVSFGAALDALARRAGLDLGRLMEEHPRAQSRIPLAALTPPRGSEAAVASQPAAEGAPPRPASLFVPPTVVEHYHRTFCERRDARAYLEKRGLTDADLLRVLKVGYADGSLPKAVSKTGELREELVALGIVTPEGRELLGGCIVVPIPDPLTGQWVNLYGRGLRTERHCYLPGPLRGVLNFQAARLSPEVVLTESVFDAVSFHQAGISIALPIYGTNGRTAEHRSRDLSRSGRDWSASGSDRSGERRGIRRLQKEGWWSRRPQGGPGRGGCARRSRCMHLLRVVILAMSASAHRVLACTQRLAAWPEWPRPCCSVPGLGGMIQRGESSIPVWVHSPIVSWAQLCVCGELASSSHAAWSRGRAR